MGISFAVKDINGKEHVWKGSELDRSLSAGNIMKHFVRTTCRTNARSGAVKGVSFSFEDRNGEEKTIKGSAIDRKLSAGKMSRTL